TDAAQGLDQDGVGADGVGRPGSVEQKRDRGRLRASDGAEAAGPRAGDGPFDVPIELLRERTSEKWRAYGPDVLPMFVAEMDVVPPRAVADAVDHAVRSGDTGYGHGHAYAEAFVGFAAERFGWTVDPAVTRTVPDVMRGVVEVVRL
ncbi:hypothetical protein ACQX8Y_14930, partial [Staphylococcus aureus]